jgi:hypothetical protein
MMLRGVSVRFNPFRDDVLCVMCCKRRLENGQLLVRFQTTEKPLAASSMPAAVQRNAIAAFRHRFTLRQTRRTVTIMFSIELVQASERLSLAGRPRRLAVSISSSAPLGLLCVVEFPCLPERPAYRCMQRLGQPARSLARVRTGDMMHISLCY